MRLLITTIIFDLLLLVACPSYGKDDGRDVKTLRNTVFIFDEAATDKYFTHFFTPLENDITVYSMTGKSFTMKKGDRYNVSRIVKGNYAGYNGLWLEFFDLNKQPHSLHLAYYARLDQLKDLQPEMDADYEKFLKEKHESDKKEFWSNVKGVAMFIAFVASLVGLAFLFFPNGVSKRSEVSSDQGFIGDGSIWYGKSDGLGGFKESSTGHTYKRSGGKYTKRKW